MGQPFILVQHSKLVTIPPEAAGFRHFSDVGTLMKNRGNQIKYMQLTISDGDKLLVFFLSSTDGRTGKFAIPQINKEIVARSGPLWGKVS